MWLKIIVFALIAANILLLLKIYFDRKNNRNSETTNSELENLTTPQLKEQFETFKQHKNNLLRDFVKKSTEEQQKTMERLQNIDEKIERLREVLAERGEFDFLKNNSLNS